MDGVPGLTQPAVASGDSFGYDFTVPDAGTYFFHPHVGTQLDRGLYAPLIVEDPADGSDYDLEAVLVLDDWLDGVAGDPDRELERLRSEGMSMGGMSMSAPTAQSPLGGDTGDVSYPYYLINGKIAADPIVLGGRPGQRLRLRIINAAADTAFRFAVGGHPLTVTHSDGFPVQPEQAQCLLIGMGERYDAIITLQDGAFPIVAAAEGKDGSGFAVLRTGPGAAPQSSVRPAELSAAPVMADQLMSLDTVRLSAREPDRTYDIALGMEMGGYTWTPPSTFAKAKEYDFASSTPPRCFIPCICTDTPSRLSTVPDQAPGRTPRWSCRTKLSKSTSTPTIPASGFCTATTSITGKRE